MRAYHFLKDDYRSGEGYEDPWSVGESRSVRGEIAPCENGYHGSLTGFDALHYSPGSVLCLVELTGDVTPHGEPVDKYAARTRKLLAAVNIERELRLFAADCAEHVLYIFERECPDDDRPRKAIQAARDFANGEIDYVTMAAAGSATAAAAREEKNTVWRTVWYTKWFAAEAAAGATGAAAAHGAREAAWYAAVDAAWYAAKAAGVEAEASVYTEAKNAERAWQRQLFEEYLGHLFDDEEYEVR